MQQKSRIAIAWIITLFLVVQPLMPTAWAEGEVTGDSGDQQNVEVVNDDQSTNPSNGEGETPPPPPEEPEPKPEEPADDPEENEPAPVVDTPVLLGEYLNQDRLHQATCDTAPWLNLQPLWDEPTIANVEFSDEWGNVLHGFDVSTAAGTQVWVKVTFIENHVLDDSSHPSWHRLDDGRAAVFQVVFTPAPTDADCTVERVLPAPTVVTDETGENAPDVEIAHIAEVEGVQSVAVEGDVVAGDDVVVRVVFEHRNTLDAVNSTDWNLDANGDALYVLTIPSADEEATGGEEGSTEGDEIVDEGETEGDEPEDTNLVALPAPEVNEDEETNAPVVETDEIENTEGVENVSVEGDVEPGAEILVVATLDDDAELDEENSDEGWESQDDGTAVFSLTLAGGIMPMAVDPEASGITGFTITLNDADPEDPSRLQDPENDSFRMEFDYEMQGDPNLEAGDSYSFTVEGWEQLGGPTVEQIDLYDGPVIIGAASIDENGVVTLVFNEQVDGSGSVTGNVWVDIVNTWAPNLVEDEDVDVDFTVETIEGSITQTITIPGQPEPEPDPPGVNPVKTGEFTRGDEGRINQDGAIEWTILAPHGGPTSQVVITDQIPNYGTDAQNWEFDLDSVELLGVASVQDGEDGIDVAFDEATGTLTITISDYHAPTAGEAPGIRILANIINTENDADIPHAEHLVFSNSVTSITYDEGDEPINPGGNGDSADLSQREIGTGNDPAKWGAWNDENQVRDREPGVNSDPGAISWYLRVPSGPSNGVVLTDVAQDGWVFDLAEGFEVRQVGGETVGFDVDFSSTEITITVDPYSAFQIADLPVFEVTGTVTASQPGPDLPRTPIDPLNNTVSSVFTDTNDTAYEPRTASAQIVQEVPAEPVLDNARKSGAFTRRDNGQYNPEEAIQWTITLPSGPNHGVIVEDFAETNEEGAVWTFSCESVSITGGTYWQEGDANAPDLSQSSDPIIECEDGALTVTFPNGYASGQPVITVLADIEVPFAEGQQLTNSANISVRDYLTDDDWGEDGWSDVDVNDTRTQEIFQGGTGSRGQRGEFLVSVGDYVWFDENRDGWQDEGEPGIRFVQVQLWYEATEDSGIYVPVDSTFTNEEGYYWFDGLQSDGRYYIQFIEPTQLPDGTPLGGWTIQRGGDEHNVVPPAPAPGSDAARDSNVDPTNGRIYFTAPTMGANQTGPGATDNPTLDAGLVLPQVSIGDYVWFDYDRDGVQGTHPNEYPVEGVTVNLYEEDGVTLVATTTTNDAGFYSFVDLEPSTEYVLEFIEPAEYDGWTLQDQGDDDARDSDVDPATGRVDVTTPATGNNSATAPDVPTYDAGLIITSVSIGDYVWLDANLNGVQDEGEDPVAGVAVRLYDADGEFVADTVTDGNGYYFFTGLEPLGTYTLEFDAPDGYAWTQSNAGDDDTIDSDVVVDHFMDRTGVIAEFQAPEFGVNQPWDDVYVADMADDPTLDGGLVQLVSVGDYVWFDYDQDGVQGTHDREFPVEGVRVNLYEEDGETLVAFTTTDENGFYSFNNLYPDTEYVLEFEMPEEYDAWTLQDEGDDDTLDSDVDSDGRVTFTSPEEGTNSLNQPDDPTLDAGLIITSVSIGDYVWYDANLNGIQDEGELAAAGIPVSLYTADGTPVGATTTNDEGYYWFTGLEPNTDYYLIFEAPENYAWTEVNAGEDDTVDSDVVPTTLTGREGRIDFTSPQYGANMPWGDEYVADMADDPTLDGGLVPLVSVGDYVWFDYDRDGVQGTDDNEFPVENVTVRLYEADGETLVAETTTDENGFYSFNNLYPDTGYVLEFVQPANYDGWTLQDEGDDDTLDSDVDSDGRVTFTSPEEGSNSLTQPDDPTLDAGLIITSVSIGDYVWLDANLNGIQDEGETPVAGVPVTLYDAEGEFVAETVTDENGYYFFTGLEPLATYTLEFEAPEGYAWTQSNAGDDDTVDSDVVVDHFMDRTGVIAEFQAPEFGFNRPWPEQGYVADMADDPTLDGGLVLLVSVGDYVWFDFNRDGIQDPDEEPVADVTVTLRDQNGDVVGTTTTNEHGFYSFVNLYPGVEYTLEFERPERFDNWTVQGGGDENNPDPDEWIGNDSNVDADGNVTFTSPLTGENSATNPDNDTLDAGLVIERVSIGDYVWYDENRDGVQDPDEPGVPGVTVILYDEEGEEVDRTTTDENGYYEFGDLTPDTEYTLEFERPDDYTEWTTPNSGDDPARDSDVDPNGRVTITTPEFGRNELGPDNTDDPTIDAGLIRLISVGDYVWYDENRNGIQDEGEQPIAGVTVTISGPDGFTATTTTDEDGYYYFQDLFPETEYTITFEKPDGYTEWTIEGAGDDESVDSNVDEDGTYTFTTPRHGNNLIGPGEADDPTIDAGLVIKVSVGDYVWYDANRNGIQDEGEQPIAGVTVTIFGPDGFTATTTTDENGYYYFQDLYPETEYTIIFEKPDGYTEWTVREAGDDRSVDSNVDENGTYTFTTPETGNNLIGPGEADDPTIDAGLVIKVSVGDYVWYDENGNGIQDEGEQPASGIKVHLYRGTELVGSTTTDENGYYYFQDLFPNTEYTLVFEKPEGYDWTEQGAGDDPARDSNADPFGVVTFTTPSTGSNLIGPDATDLPTLDAGLVKKPDPATPDPEKKPEPVKELPSTGIGTESNALGFALASVFGLMAAAVALRLNAYKRS